MNSLNNLENILQSLGGLHDSVVRRVNWIPESSILEFEIEDLYSNFRGLPEYSGAEPGCLVFEGVEHARFDIETQERRLNIHEMLIEELPEGGFCVSVMFWPTGKIVAKYRSAHMQGWCPPDEVYPS